MHEFGYIDNQLYCELVPVERLAEKYGTPLYIYSRKTLVSHYKKIKDAFRNLRPLICYSMKANSNLKICRILVREGAGLDIVSGGELYKALKIGVSPKKIVYAGVGKSEEEIYQAIKNNILLLNVESISELKLIDKISRRLRKRQAVAIRINPHIKPKTHRYITTGYGGNKFGVDIETAKNIFLNRWQFENVDISGIHIHIGSQIVDAKPFVKAIQRIGKLVKRLQDNRIGVKWFNIGGGLGIIYSNESPQTAQEYADTITPVLKKINANLIIEPGRFISGNSGVLLTKVVYIKKTEWKNFAIVDAGMNDLIRPSLYGAYHEVLPVRPKSYNSSGCVSIYDIVGPVCESGDFIAKGRKFIGLKEGDLLGIMGAGAYGYSMASNYNSRPRPAEVLVEGKKDRLIRRREMYRDLTKMEEEVGSQKLKVK